MVLAAEERGLIIAARDFVHGFDVVGVILRVEGDLLVDGLVAGQLQHDVLDGLGVIRAGRGAHPGAAPVIGLRAFANRVIAEDAVADFFLAALSDRNGQRVAQQGEVDAPSGVEEAEDLAFRTLIGRPSVIPELGLVVVALVGEFLGLLDPLHQVRVNLDGRAVHPRSGNVVGEGAVAVVVAGEHLVALFGGLRGDLVELIPIAQVGLHLGGTVRAEHILGDGAAVGEQTRSRLPSHALEHAVGRRDILRVFILAVQIAVGQADVGADIQRVRRIHILERVVGLDEEHVDLVVIGGGFLREERFVQLVLVVVVGVRVDRPLDDRAVVQGRGGLIFRNFLDFRIVGVEAGLEFVVPAPDVQHAAFGERDAGQRAHRKRKSQSLRQMFPHDKNLLFIVHPRFCGGGIACYPSFATVLPAIRRQGTEMISGSVVRGCSIR